MSSSLLVGLSGSWFSNCVIIMLMKSLVFSCDNGLDGVDELLDVLVLLVLGTGAYDPTELLVMLRVSESLQRPGEKSDAVRWQSEVVARLCGRDCAFG